MPWSKNHEKSGKKDFYKGAFDSIPFLNDDAKRTFVHLLLRPGYMIRDYIRGQSERYLAPLTSLIIFYAFFALVSSIVNPDLSRYDAGRREADRHFMDSVMAESAAQSSDSLNLAVRNVKRIALNLDYVTDLLSLDEHPENVDTRAKASLAALESALRSQGVYLFLGEFLLLWIAMFFALKKHDMRLSACAATAAYVLCQFCFFMFFSLFIPGIDKGRISVGLMAVLLTIDFRQQFGTTWGRSVWLSMKTGLFCALILLLLVLLIVVTVTTAAFIAV